MIFSAGVRLGPYEIEAPVGAGGMGEVYRARDTRLERTVAIKVLPAGAAAREELRQRFEREARTISSLNHPHICALYDVGQQDGTDFLVMEYLEGETLGHRLVRGPLPTEQVLRLGREIADALDKAHRQRIVHRDLKPANIMLTKAGVKLMDFGLAKLTQTISPVVQTLSRMTTQDSKITEEGVIVGTFQYMAPEQLEGHEADPRSDIFALGAVFYEMVTGRPAFQGKTRASLIAAILSSEPAPMSQLQPLTPPALDRVVKACLAKEPDDRIQTAHDVLLELKWIAEAGSEAGVPAPIAGRRKVRERLAWALVAFFLVTTTIAIIGYLGRAPEPGRAVRFEVGATANVLSGEFIAQKVSPDGRMIAFFGEDASGRRSLWVRALDASEPRKLQSVETPVGIVWAPDSRTLVWLDESKVRRIDVTGGPPEIVCSVQTQGGVTVNGEEIFLANPREDGPLLRFAANHCAPEEATKLDHSKHFSHAHPFFLPDGRHFLYSALAADKNHQIWAASLDSPEGRLVLQNASRPVYVEPGYLLFARHGILMAQPFNWKSMRLSGEAVRLEEEQLVFSDLYGFANFSASNTGVLVYQLQPELRSQLSWFDRGGRLLSAVLGEPEALGNDPRLSPDEKSFVAGRYDPSTHLSDLWMYHLDRSTWTRLTSSSTPGGKPAVWSPDGSRIVYSAVPPSGPPQSNLYTISSSGGNSELLLESGDDKVPTDWSPDRRFVLFELYRPDAGADLWLLELATRKLSPLVQTSADQTQGRFSPDGNWLAYVSNESGRSEVYLRAVTGGSRIQVSTGGGSLPRWRTDGRGIYYTTPDSKLMLADLTPKAAHGVGVPRVLFGLPRGASYEVARDGRFLVNLPLSTHEQNRLSVVVNWTAMLKK